MNKYSLEWRENINFLFIFVTLQEKMVLTKIYFYIIQG